jgi:phage-related protein (TIGR01555 family)
MSIMAKETQQVKSRAERLDGWQNTITGLGRSRDKLTGTAICPPLTQPSRDEFDDWYNGDHTSQKIARLPAREMTREWISLKVDDSIDNDTKTEASTSDKMITAKQVEGAMDDLGVKGVMTKALTWARVHGGALIYMSVNKDEDLTTPLDLDNIKTLNFLRVYDRWEAEITSAVSDFDSERDNEPEMYRITPYPLVGARQHEDHQREVHASRLVRLDGTLVSPQRLNENSGWADSVYTQMRQTLDGYGISWVAVMHLLSDFSQAVLKMKGLADAIMQQEGNVVLDRMMAMDLCRSVARAIPIDAEDEDFMRAQTPMSGLPETIDRLMLLVASAADIPATLLFGQSPAGLNATGESDIRFFYDQIKAKQEEVLRPAIDRVLEVLFASKEGPTKGREPENWSYEFNPLWQETDQERATTRKTQAEADSIYLADGVLDPDEVAMSRFGGDTYSTDTVLDMEKRAEVATTEPDEPVGEEEGDENE